MSYALLILGSLASGMTRPSRTIVSVLVLAMVLLTPLQHAYVAARAYLPRINDAWWETFTNIRERSHPDAIINLSWDRGHWAKYVAERRVSSDGASLLTHVPHWMSRVFIASNERASVGVLRMLNCGSDAAALPEGRHGAYRKVRTKVRSTSHSRTALAPVVAHGSQ